MNDEQINALFADTQQSLLKVLDTIDSVCNTLRNQPAPTAQVAASGVIDDLIRQAVAPLEQKIAELEARLESNTPAIDYNQLAACVDCSELADHVDASDIADCIDPADVASNMDAEDVASNIDFDDAVRTALREIISH